MKPVAVVRDHIAASAREADALHARSRALLVAAAREGHAHGMTQREIAQAIGRSQPEVSRLLRFSGTTPLGRRLTERRTEVLAIVRAHGGRDPHVFGSVATGADTDESDIDLLVTFPIAPSLIGIARLERELTAAVGVEVDVLPTCGLRPPMRNRILKEAVPL